MTLVWLIFLHLFLFFWVRVHLYLIRGDGAARAYDLNRHRKRLTLAGKMDDRERYIRITRAYCRFTLAGGLLLYLFLLFLLLRQY